MSQTKPTVYPCWVYLKEGGKLVKDESEFNRAVRVYDIGSDDFTEREWYDSPDGFRAEQPVAEIAEVAKNLGFPTVGEIEQRIAKTVPKKRGRKPKQ